MAKKKETSLDAILTAALQVAGRMPWEQVTLQDIAKAAKISLKALRGHIEAKDDILAAYGRRVDEALLESMQGTFSSAAEEREKLFDILMERFDILNRDRAAVISIAKSMTFSPPQVIATLPHVMRSMLWMLEMAEADVAGLKGCLRVVGLTGVYLYALKVFIEDESTDLAKTMAAVDSALARAEKISGFINL